MNEDKVMQVIINLKKFNEDLMDLNIKYAEEIERLEKRNKEIYEGFNNIINTLEDSIVGKINVLYQVRGQSNAIQELSILLRQLRELKGGSSND